jgi:hypothetical protein
MAGGSDASALGALHERLLRDRSLQFEFTALKPPPPEHVPDWLRALGAWLARLIGAALPLLKVAFWIGLAALILLLIFVIVREAAGRRWSWRRRAAKRPPPTDWRPDARKARALLENADRLAAQGRFDQAVRLILHRGIDDIDIRRPRAVRPALTAREIAGSDALPPAARPPFMTMAAIVEYSAFAGQPIGQDAFARCRAAYEAFAFPEVWA